MLSSDESHHLTRVLRLVTGDAVEVFDGKGHEFAGRVARADRFAAKIALVAALPGVPEPAVPTVVVQAVLKGDKMDGVIRDATMAGVAVIVPIVTARSLVNIPALRRAHALERWQRIAIASAKQCRRSRLPEIELARPFDDWLSAPFDGPRLLMVEPSAGRDGAVPMRQVLEVPPPPAVACVVGPEGGWTDLERDAAARAGCIATSLGPMTFRADAVALVAASILTFAFEPPSA